MEMNEELGGPKQVDEAVFTINGKLYRAGKGLPVNMSLNTYIRDYALLPGTKYMCKEGSCGCCVVNIRYKDNPTHQITSFAANSCLLPVLACHGYAITTVEGLGSRATGYNKVQTTLAHFNGTQCGYCSPGFVMSMHSLLDRNPKATVDDVENNFSGNLCRCTGYRPILDAFKSLASNPPTKLKQMLLEIEESHVLCPNRGKCDGDGNEERCKTCMSTKEDDVFELDFSELTLAKENFHLSGPDSEWYRACCLKEIFQIFDRIGPKSYMLVAGNTARGVQKPAKEPDVYIDINSVDELKATVITSSSFSVGSMVRQTELLEKLRTAASNRPNSYGYGKQMADHIMLIANVPVRNRATIGGNLGLVSYLKDFPSDIYLLLDTLGASITIAMPSGITRNITPTEFRSTDMHRKVLTKITLPGLSSSIKLLSYKIMPLSQSAVAIVNAGFLYDIDKTGRFNNKPSIVLSGINTTFRHAYKTESYLSGKNLFSADVLKKAIDTLYSELQPDDVLPRLSPAYRKLLGTALFYRSVLFMAGDKADAKYRSGSTNLVRPISSGKQVYQSDQQEYPLSQPMPKLEAQIQTAGEAIFINDYQKLRHELFGHFVLAKKFADFQTIDASKALKMPGVVAFLTAKDIPGTNNVAFPFINYFGGNTELFSSGKVSYWGQPLGMIVAETDEIAEGAVNEVVVVYKAPKKPLLTIRDVLKSSETSTRVVLQQSQKATKSGSGGKYDLEGEVDIVSGGTFTHSMETPSCRVLPQENGQYRVEVSTQTITVTKGSIAQIMNIPLNKIDCVVPRVGGSFGGKNTSQLYGACACVLAASKLQRPVRNVLTVPEEMDAIGKRTPFYAKYKGKCDEKGKIQGMDIDIYIDYGYTKIMDVYFAVMPCIQNYFDSSTWNINIYNVYTDKTPMLILRGPGFMESISIIEQVIDHAAFLAKVDPTDARITNSSDDIINGYIKDWRKQTDYDNRKKAIDQFNTENRWRKKGLSLTAMRYPFSYEGNQMGCNVAILYPDGTVQIQHAGVEMGQGINTKVAQVVAHELGLTLDMIQVKPHSSLNSPNCTPTWTSLGSELVVFAALDCCKQLNDALKPVKDSLKNPTWKQVVMKAFDQSVPLAATVPLGKFPSQTFGLYYVYGVCVTETEIDILTGQHQVSRVDLLEDVGKSMSPEVDVGQVEGAFVMALGIMTTEKLVYDPKTGALVTDRLWYFHVPRSKDIPIDFRVTFIPNATNPNGVLNSKATGEPATALAVSILTSLRNGLMSARSDAGLSDAWIQLESPCTPETVMMASGTAKEQFVLK